MRLRERYSSSGAHLKIPKLRELPVALLEPTREGLDLRMNDSVCAYVATLREALSTVLA